MPPRRIILWEVDVQADFMLAGGRLYVPGAEKIIPNIRRLIAAATESGTLVISSCDSHPEGDPEFERFPPHCLRGTPGAEILPDAMTRDFCTVLNDVNRTMPADIAGFRQIVLEKQTLDVFDNPHASMLVAQLGSDVQYVVFGVVTEYCVQFAAKGLLQRGRNVAVVADAIATLDPAIGRRTLEELQARGARLITTDETVEKVMANPARRVVQVPGQA